MAAIAHTAESKYWRGGEDGKDKHTSYCLVENLSQMPWHTFPWVFLAKCWSHDHALAGREAQTISPGFIVEVGLCQ